MPFSTLDQQCVLPMSHQAHFIKVKYGVTPDEAFLVNTNCASTNVSKYIKKKLNWLQKLKDVYASTFGSVIENMENMQWILDLCDEEGTLVNMDMIPMMTSLENYVTQRGIYIPVAVDKQPETYVVQATLPLMLDFDYHYPGLSNKLEGPKSQQFKKTKKHSKMGHMGDKHHVKKRSSILHQKPANSVTVTPRSPSKIAPVTKRKTSTFFNKDDK